MSYFRWACWLWLPALLIVLTGRGLPVQAQEHAAEDAVTAEIDHDSDGAAAHGTAGEHHDPYDKSAANASASLEAPEEFRSDLAIWTFVVFGALLLVLWKFAWGPISEALDRRERGIADQLDEARRSNEESHRLLAQHQQQLAQASNEVKSLLEQARRDGEALKQRLVTEAEQVAQTQRDRAVREIDAAKNAALEDLARQSVEQAVGLAGRIVGQHLNKEDHAKLIQESLDRLPSRN